MADKGMLRFRLLRDSPIAASAADDPSATMFGLQDNREQIHAGTVRPDGMIAFEFTLRVAPASDETKPPVFTGPFAFGSPRERFVYLSWQRTELPGYVNRIKARLGDIDWALVHAAQASGGTLEADMSGRKAGGGTIPVDWRLIVPEPAEPQDGEDA